MTRGRPRKKVKNTSGLKRGKAKVKATESDLGNNDMEEEETCQNREEPPESPLDSSILKPLELAMEDASDLDSELGEEWEEDIEELGFALADMARRLEE